VLDCHYGRQLIASVHVTYHLKNALIKRVFVYKKDTLSNFIYDFDCFHRSLRHAIVCLFVLTFNLHEDSFPETLCPFLSPSQNATTCSAFKIPLCHPTHRTIRHPGHFALLLALPHLQPLYGSPSALLCHAHKLNSIEYLLIKGTFLLLSDYNIALIVNAFK
jgi:hypothetical protein